MRLILIQTHLLGLFSFRCFLTPPKEIIPTKHQEWYYPGNQTDLVAVEKGFENGYVNFTVTDNLVFNFRMKSDNKNKSRVELTHCFLKESDFDEEKVLSLSKAKNLQHFCPVAAKKYLKNTHYYSYDLRIDTDSLTDNSKFILTQWHGHARHNLFKDTFGNITYFSSDHRQRYAE